MIPAKCKIPPLLTFFVLTQGMTLSPAEAMGDTPSESYIVASDGFLSSYSDLRYQNLGVAAYRRGNYVEAFMQFHHAARYADKLSQALIAMMLWDGIGTKKNHSEAYAWMDLAAERGYRQFAALRETYWQSLDADEQKNALLVGKEIYNQYSDAVAKPRLELELKLAPTSTGTRLRENSGYKVKILLLAFNVHIDSSEYYSSQYWNPKEYWHWVDQQYEKPLLPNVTVSPPIPTSSRTE